MGAAEIGERAPNDDNANTTAPIIIISALVTVVCLCGAKRHANRPALGWLNDEAGRRPRVPSGCHESRARRQPRAIVWPHSLFTATKRAGV